MNHTVIGCFRFRATYGFEVQNPVQEAAEVPPRYSFDYLVQTPVIKSDSSTLQGLSAHVDRVVVQRQGMLSDRSFSENVLSYRFFLRLSRERWLSVQQLQTDDRPPSTLPETWSSLSIWRITLSQSTKV